MLAFMRHFVGGLCIGRIPLYWSTVKIFVKLSVRVSILCTDRACLVPWRPALKPWEVVVIVCEENITHMVVIHNSLGSLTNKKHKFISMSNSLQPYGVSGVIMYDLIWLTHSWVTFLDPQDTKSISA